MASYQDGSSLEFCHGHKREQSQDSGAYIDWNSEDSASPVGNPDNTMSEDFITVVAVENGSGIEGKKEETPFVTILAIGEAGENSGKEMQSGMEEEVLVYRLPGERLGFGLKFEGGTNTAENVKRLFIQSSAPDSPASRAKCSWGSLEEGDEILKIDGNVVKSMTRLDCVRCLKESSVVIKLHVRHKSQKAVQQGSRFKAENSNDLRANNTSSSSPTVVSAEMKKNIPPPPPVPPRKITKKNSNSVVRETMVNPPEGFCDMQNGENPKPKTRNMQNGPTDETSKNSSRYVIRVPQKANLDSPDLSKHTIKRNGSDSKLAPPEPKVYLDMLTQEDNRNGESESDDTCSTVSTVVGLSSVPNTTNSSFSDLRSSASSFCDSTNPSTPASSEPTTPVLELSRMLSPFDHSQSNDFLFSKLINGKDPDSISYDEKITNCADEIIPLQPPLSFQDAPLSYGNEEMRTNLSENLNSFQDESLSNCLKNHQDEITNERDSSGDGKSKDKNTILSKKPSLIPRLAKSIGLLSPPKPSPRKESRGDGGKSRFNKKKPPPLPPLNDKNNQTLQDDHENNKTLKSSIPYLKKKKNKNEDGKKNGKGEKKLKISEDLSKEKQNCSVNDFDSHHEAHENMINDADKNVSEILKTPETERSIMWEVPDMKDAAESNPDENENATTENNKENENSKIPADEPDKYLSDFENCKSNDKMNESCEPHFMFPWSGSKQLETIGEDEEVDDVTEK